MPHLLITTINRACPASECSGYVYAVDSDTGAVLSRHPVPEASMRAFDPNPRGGMRGGRGIAVRGRDVYIANFDTIFRYEGGCGFVPFVSHPSCADIHDIALIDGMLWVTSTRNDLLLQFDADGSLAGYHNVRTWSQVRNRLGWHDADRLDDGAIHSGRIDFRDPTSHEKCDFDGAHVNGLCGFQDGSVYATLGLISVRNELEGGQACIVRIRKGAEPKPVFVRENIRVAIHNVSLQPDGTLLFLDTSEGTLMRINPETGTLLSCQAFPSKYLRGLCRFEDGRLAIGDQNSILLHDPAASSPYHRIALSDNARESVHSISSLG